MSRSLLLLVACTLLLSACAGKTVSVLDDAQFHTMAVRIAPVLKTHNILDDGGAYLTPMGGFSENGQEQDAGNRLFAHLSPAFRFQEMDARLLPRTFAASKAPGDSLTMQASGFTLGQGINFITVQLLALADWNDDGVDDWFVLCKVKSILNDTERDYYLVVTDPAAEVIIPQLLAVYDCRSQQCTVYMETGSKNQARAVPETAIIEVAPGQRSITAPPSDTKKPEGPSEQKLGS